MIKNMESLPQRKKLTDIVRAIARQHIMPHFGRVTRQYKADSSIVTDVDIATQAALVEQLQKHWPEFDFLAEEMTPEQQQQQMANHEQGLWIVDPLDGTSNFAAGIPYFAISVALYTQGEISLGLVYDPNRDEAFFARVNEPAMLNEKQIEPAVAPKELARTIGVIDFKRLPAQLAARLATQQPFSSQRSFGSVALDWCWLAANRFHIYLHGRSNIWDYAAGELIFRQAGGHSCTLQGESIFSPQLTPRSAVAAMDSGHFEQWCNFLDVPH